MSLPGLRLVLGAALLALALTPAAAGASAQDAAFAHVQANATSLGVTAADVSELGITSSYTSRHNGVTHVNVAQRYEGLEVFGGYATVNVAANGSVLFAGGSLVRGLTLAAGVQHLGTKEAVSAAADELGLAAPEGLQILSLDLKTGKTILVDRRHLRLADHGAARLAADGGRAPARLAGRNRQLRRRELLERDGGRRHRRAPEEGRRDDHRRDRGSRGGRPRRQASGGRDRVRAGPRILAEPGHRRLVLPRLRPRARESERRRPPARLQPGRQPRLAVRLARHRTAPPAPSSRSRAGTTPMRTSTRTTNNAPDFGADVEGGAGLLFDNPIDLNEHSQAYRDAVVTNLFFGCNTFHDLLYIRGFDEVVRELPGKQLRSRPGERRRAARRLRPLRGRRRQRDEQRQLQPERRPHADVPLARQPARKPEPRLRPGCRRLRRRVGALRTAGHERRRLRPVRERRERLRRRGLRGRGRRDRHRHRQQHGLPEHRQGSRGERGGRAGARACVRQRHELDDGPDRLADRRHRRRSRRSRSRSPRATRSAPPSWRVRRRAPSRSTRAIRGSATATSTTGSSSTSTGTACPPA